MKLSTQLSDHHLCHTFTPWLVITAQCMTNSCCHQNSFAVIGHGDGARGQRLRRGRANELKMGKMEFRSRGQHWGQAEDLMKA